jgi:16S rRNA (guanine1516-N2)-methyltransferase
MLVTTSQKASPVALEQAMQAAAALGWTYMERRTLSLAQLRERLEEQLQAVGRTCDCSKPMQTLVLANGAWHWYPDEIGESVFFHPSMAHVRIKRLMNGEHDVLLQVANLVDGDRVLDCTAGMASDSIVLAHGAGPHGSVTALESTPALAFLIEQGLQSYESRVLPLQAAMRAVNVRCIDHLTFLRQQAEQTFDVVYFDPMFRKPLQDANVIDPLRVAVNPDALRLEAVQQAVRVARKCVILKETRYSPEFERLGFQCERKFSGKICYGVIRL